MSITETIAKWDLIISQVPYRRDEPKESKAIIHMPVAHPDRDKEKPNLTCPGITWAELNELIEYCR